MKFRLISYQIKRGYMSFQGLVLSVNKDHIDYLFNLIMKHVIPFIRGEELKERSQQVAADDTVYHRVFIHFDGKTCEFN